jgi:hypothetical protein
MEWKPFSEADGILTVQDCLSWNLKFYYRIHMSLQLDYTLRQAYAVLTHYLF